MCVGFGPQLGGFAVPNCVCWKDEYGLQQLKKRDELAEGELCAASAATLLGDRGLKEFCIWEFKILPLSRQLGVKSFSILL